MSAQAQPRLSPEEYLEIERAATTRSEYFNGRMYAMAGGTFNHGCIIGNLIGELHAAFKKTTCRVVPNDLKVRVASDGLYTYPDVVAVCGKPDFADGEKDVLLNPALILEVLSPSTEAYHRGFKAVQYRKLPSLQEYALVSQAEARIEIFRRQASGDWMLSEYAGTHAICRFASVNCEMALSGLYDRIVFEGEDPLSAHPSY